MEVVIAEELPWSSVPKLSNCPPGLFCRKTAEHRISQQQNFVMDIKLDDYFFFKKKMKTNSFKSIQTLWINNHTVLNLGN